MLPVLCSGYALLLFQPIIGSSPPLACVCLSMFAQLHSPWFGGAHGSAVVSHHTAAFGAVEIVDDAATLQRVFFKKPAICAHATKATKDQVGSRPVARVLLYSTTTALLSSTSTAPERCFLFRCTPVHPGGQVLGSIDRSSALSKASGLLNAVDLVQVRDVCAPSSTGCPSSWFRAPPPPPYPIPCVRACVLACPHCQAEMEHRSALSVFGHVTCWLPTLRTLSLVFATVVNVLMLVGYGTLHRTPLQPSHDFLMHDVAIDNAPLGYYAVRVIIL